MPSDPDNNQSLVIRRSPGTSVPATPTSGTAIATLSATNLTFEDTSELTPGATYSYSIFLRDLDGYFSNPSSVSVIAPNPPVGVNWGSATVPVPYTDGVRDLECPTADFCMLIGGAAYQTWSGGEWSEPVALPDPFDISSTVSCGSADLCMITRGRQFSVFNGQAWSPADVVSQSIPDDYRFEYMECAASSCLATTSYNYSLRWNGASWNIAPKSSNDLNFGDSVHCAADNLCFSGNAEWNGTQWIGSGSPGFGVDGMSCASTTFCVWVGLTRGDMTRYNGQGWASMASPWNSQGLQYVDVACTAPTFCISVAQTGDYPVGTQFSTFDGASWSAPANLDPAFGTRAQVECLSSARCFVAAISATHGDVHLSSYENGSWSAPVTVTHGNHLAGVSCIPNGVCVSSDFAGNIRTSAGSTWSAPTLVDPASGVKSLSCGSATFCAVVDDGGGAVVKANGIWGSRQVLTSGVALDFLSCTSDQACMAMSSSGVAVQYQNGQWTDVSSPTYFPGPVACGSMNYCVGDGYWWNGSVWQQMPGTQGRYGFSATCLTPTDCLVSYGAYSSGKPTAAHFVNGAWSGAPYPIGRSTYYNHGVRVDSISCFAADRCAAVGSDGLVTFSSGGVTVGPPVPVWRGGGSGVSCSSATLCVAFVGEYVWISH